MNKTSRASLTLYLLTTLSLTVLSLFVAVMGADFGVLLLIVSLTLPSLGVIFFDDILLTHLYLFHSRHIEPFVTYQMRKKPMTRRRYADSIKLVYDNLEEYDYASEQPQRYR